MAQVTQRPAYVHLILVRGQISKDRVRWFDGFQMHDILGHFTLLAGVTRDQSELHGLLERIFSLGLELMALQTIPVKTLEKEVRQDGPR